MKENQAVKLIATHSAAASRVDSRAFAFSSGVRFFSELFYYSFTGMLLRCARRDVMPAK
mgnify:CR=1 FL=1